MTDKEYKEQKLRIKKLISKWFHPAGFGWWRVDFIYSRDRHPDNQNVAGETRPDWKYSHGSITYYLPVIAELSDEELEHTFVHELCHLTISGLMIPDDDSATAIWERTVDDFAKHLIWAREAGADDK